MKTRPSPRSGRLRVARGGVRTRVVLTLAICALSLGAALFAALTWGPSLARDWIAQQLGNSLGRSVQIDRITSRPWRAELDITGLRVAAAGLSGTARDDAARDPSTPGKATLDIEQIRLTLDPSALLSRTLHLTNVVIEGPRLQIQRDAGGQLDIADLIARMTTAPQTTGTWAWRVDQMRLDHGHIGFQDDTVGESLEWAELRVQARGLSESGLGATANLSGTIQGARVSAQVQIEGEGGDLQATLALKLASLELRRVSPWIPWPQDVRLTDGRVEGQGVVRLKPHVQGPDRLSVQGELTLEALRLQSSAAQTDLPGPGLELRRARLELADSTPLGGIVHVNTLDLDAPQVVSGRDRQGQLHWPRPSIEGVAREDSNAFQRPAIHLARLSLRDGSVQWTEDLLPDRSTHRLDRIQIDAHELAWAADAPWVGWAGQMNLRADLDEHSPIALEAQLTPERITATVQARQLQATRWIQSLSKPSDWQISIEPVDLQAQLVWHVPDRSLKLSEGQIHTKGWDIRQAGRLVAAAQRSRVTRLDARWQEGRIDLEALHADMRQLRDAQTLALPEVSLQARIPRLNELSDHAVPVQARLRLGSADLGSADLGSAGLGSAGLGSAEQVRLDGSLQAQPLQFSGSVEMQNLDLTRLQAYLDPMLKLTLQEGRLWGSGQLRISQAGMSPDASTVSRAPSVWRAGYVGSLSVNGLRVKDQQADEALVTLSALALPTLQLQWDPSVAPTLQIAAPDIALVDFYARVILDADGSLNLQRILTNPSPPNGPRLWSLRLGTLRIASGQVDFSDRFIRPNYRADLSRLSGEIRPTSADPQGPSEVEIRGWVDGDTPLEITGQIHPFAEEPWLDLRAVARGFDLPKLSPYSGKWAGYAIEKGSLTANVRYRLRGSRLEAENRLVINQLTFGAPVESPDAFRLPVQLAVSLLKDANGVIDLDLPIAGSISDPQFSVGGLIWRAIGNLALKVVSAPFTALASLLRGDSASTDFSHLPFSAGSAELTDDDRTRLDALAQALVARPGVSLDLIGLADPVTDRDALTQARLRQLLEQNREPLSTAREQALRERAEATDDDLRDLARARAQTARRELRDRHGLPLERLFMVAPRLAQPGDPLPARRVSFELK